MYMVQKNSRRIQRLNGKNKQCFCLSPHLGQPFVTRTVCCLKLLVCCPAGSSFGYSKELGPLISWITRLPFPEVYSLIFLEYP